MTAVQNIFVPLSESNKVSSLKELVFTHIFFVLLSVKQLSFCNLPVSFDALFNKIKVEKIKMEKKFLHFLFCMEIIAVLVPVS